MTEIIVNTYNDFINFLTKRDVLDVGVAFVISTQITLLSSVFIDSIVSPCINAMTGGNEEKLDNMVVPILGVDIEIGKFLSAILKFIIVMLFIFYLFKLIGHKNLQK